MEFHKVLSQFCGGVQPHDHSTPKLGVTALKEDGSWGDLESNVDTLRTLWSPGKGTSVPAGMERGSRSPLRHTAARARHSLNLGARRDPVGSIGELVAKAARDRFARCLCLPEILCFQASLSLGFTVQTLPLHESSLPLCQHAGANQIKRIHQI